MSTCVLCVPLKSEAKVPLDAFQPGGTDFKVVGALILFHRAKTAKTTLSKKTTSHNVAQFQFL